MPAIIALVLIAIAALTVLSFAVHVLFSPWLLVAIGPPATLPPVAWPHGCERLSPVTPCRMVAEATTSRPASSG